MPAVARYVLFNLAEPGADAPAIKDALTRLTPLVDGSDVVVGIGPSLVQALGAEIPGLHEFPDFSRPRRQGARRRPGTLWCWLRGDDLGDLLHVTRKVQKALAPAFAVRHVVDAFRHAWRRAATATTSPVSRTAPRTRTGEAAEEAAFAHGLGEGLDGSSYVAVQQWVHDLDAFEALERRERDHHIGRRLQRQRGTGRRAGRPPTSSARRRKASTRRPSCCGGPCRG